MPINGDPPLSMDLNSALRINSKELAGYLKTSTIYASFAAAILSSAYVAYSYQTNWWQITATVSLINLYALPKILHYCNATMIRNALAINLISLSSLFLGGCAAATFSMSRAMVSSLKTYQISTALFCAFGTTALLGYCLPLFQNAMKNAYRFLTQSDAWKENFSNLQEQFHRMPEMGLGLLQTNLWQNFILQLSLLKPEIVLSFWRILFIKSPDYVWSMAAAVTKKVTLDQFEELLDNFIQTSTLVTLTNEDLPDEIKENYYNRIKIAVKGLKKKDLKAALALLLTSGSKFIPRILSNDQFLELFTSDALDATNQAIEELLDQSDHWSDLVKRYHTLEADIFELEQDISQFEKDSQNSPQKTETGKQLELSEEQEKLLERKTQINQEFMNLRKDVEKIYADKRIWQDFTHLWSSGQSLPFENGDKLLDYLQDQPTMNEIDRIYRSLIEEGKKGQNSTLSDRIQLIANKMCASNETLDEEDVPSITDILALKHDFVVHDYEMLQEWLNLDSPHDLPDALAMIGLETEEDLYHQNILRHQNHQSKTIVLENFRHFIEKSEKETKLAGRVDALESANHRTKAFELGGKVARLFFHVTCSGLILAPLLILPYAGLTGFAIGSVVFVLKRLGVQRAKDLIHVSNEFIKSIPGGTFMRNIIGRHVFSITPRRREMANHFVEANFYGKMRLINVQMISTIFTSCLSMRLQQPYLGSFLQGIALANEVVSLV